LFSNHLTLLNRIRQYLSVSGVVRLLAICQVATVLELENFLSAININFWTVGGPLPEKKLMQRRLAARLEK